MGDSGAFCHLCTSTKHDANILENILNGFEINKDYNTCKAAWEKLSSGEIAYSHPDRQGQCHESIIPTNLYGFSVLHFKLRTLDFVQNVLYHFVAGAKTWSESGPHTPRFVAEAKKQCIDHIHTTTGMLIDTPTGNGGNTNCGPLADKFFSEAICKSGHTVRHHITELILNEEDRQNYSLLISKLNIILHVTQSVDEGKTVNTQKFKQFGIDIMSDIRSNFLDQNGQSWITIIPTVHQLCAHSWELFVMNMGKSIAKWSENPLESWNKHVRAFQSSVASRAKQTSVKSNIHDILKRMLISSHPLVASKRPRPSCSICGQHGHTARSSRHKNEEVMLSTEKEMINSMYI